MDTWLIYFEGVAEAVAVTTQRGRDVPAILNEARGGFAQIGAQVINTAKVIRLERQSQTQVKFHS